MQTRSFSHAYNQFKLWLPFMVLMLWFVTTSITPTAASVDITQIPQSYNGVVWNPFDLLVNGSSYDNQGWSFVFDATVIESGETYCYDPTCQVRRSVVSYSDGNFTLSGPNGLVLTANISSGWDILWVDPYVGFYHLDYELFGHGEWNDVNHQQNIFLLKGGETDDTPDHMGLLLGTPEPSSLVLLGSGVLGLAGILRRKIDL